MTSSPKPAYTNRLVSEKSPYLLQHAHNPVDWYPWGSEAFEKALKENKPIFLSIGYSTCHWCHVMEHESFEDPEVARLMNETFVSIKVDREERPDIDGLYMSVCQMMTGSGGWPLTIVMTPEKKPFFAGTYFPKENRFGRMGMLELTPKLGEAWKTRRPEITASTQSLEEELLRTAQAPGGGKLGEAILNTAYTQLTRSFDAQHGGFGNAPKFPTPHYFSFLLRYWKRTGEPKALEMTEKSLTAMRLGGIYDQIGFGFHRYSTDARWFLPHFEKMLYDQALLADAYVETYQATGNVFYKNTAEEIFAYVLRDMTSPEGAFYSAEDADSEGEEGKFYVWTAGEMEKLLSPEEADLVQDIFNAVPAGNWGGERGGDGSNILYLLRPLSELAAERNISGKELKDRLEPIRRKLFEVRGKRTRPHKDDKVLTDWNGLMIQALAKGARVFDEPEYAEAAARAADFILNKMSDDEGRLFHRHRDGETAVEGFIDDHAFFIGGLIELYEATFEVRYLEQAARLAQVMVRNFWDETNGGFFLTSSTAEVLMVRQKDFYDGAIPSGNSVALETLLHLARITGDASLEAKAARLAESFPSQAATYPAGFTRFLSGWDFALGPSTEIVLAGNKEDAGVQAALRLLREKFLPHQVVILRPEAAPPALLKLAPFLEPLRPQGGKNTFYVCHAQRCEFPVTDPEKMIELIHK